MKTLKRLSAAIALTFVLGVSAFAGCEPPAPGQIETPCVPVQMASDDPTTPGVISTPPASDAGYLVADAAISLLESLLPIF